MNKGISKMKTYWSVMLETIWAMIVSYTAGIVPLPVSPQLKLNLIHPK